MKIGNFHGRVHKNKVFAEEFNSLCKLEKFSFAGGVHASHGGLAKCVMRDFINMGRLILG